MFFIQKPLVILLFLGIIFFQTFSSTAQIDTSFWFAAPWVSPDHTERHDIVLRISTFGASSTTVHLSQPAALAPNKYDTVMVIGPNQTFNYIFWRDKLATGPPSTLTPNIGFDSLEVRPADMVVPYGLHLSSSSNIAVVYQVVTSPPGYSNPETFSLKGQNALGLEFICPQQTLYRNRMLGDRPNTPVGVLQPKQQITIVASQANTVVWITPKCNIVGHTANVTYSVLLPSAGSAYNIENLDQDTYVSGKTLSGTVITADKPIAVTVADDSINNVHSASAGPGLSTWGGMGCYDLIGDQIVPVTVLGKDYVIKKGQLFVENQLGVGNPGMKESAFIVATENLTQLTIIAGTSTITTNINKGDTYVDTLTSDLTYLHADKNVYVYHVSGIGCELGSALLPPIYCAGSKVVAFSRNTPQKFAINLLCKNGAQSTFTLNGSASLVQTSNFTLVPGTNTLSGGPYAMAQINFNSTTVLPIGSYTIGNNAAEFMFGVFDGDLTSGGLYHYTSSFANRVNVKTATLSPLCTGAANTVALTGTVSGATTQGFWSTVDGNGTVSAIYSSSNTVISTVYTLSPADTLLTSIKFYLTSAGLCKPIIDSVIMVINPHVNISIPNNITLCRNNLSPISLSGTVTNALNGTWSGSGSGSWGGSGSTTTYTVSANDITVSQLTFTLMSQNPLVGCTNVAKTLTVNFIDPSVVSAGNDTLICDKNFPGISLSGNINGVTNSGIWSGPGTGTFFPGANSPTVNYLFSNSDYSQTSFVFTLTSTNNGICSSVSDVIIIQRDTTSFMIQMNPSFLCMGNSATLAAQGTPNYLWSNLATTSLIVVSPSVTTTYTASGASALNCQFSDSIAVIVYQLPYVKIFASDSVICTGESLQLNSGGAVNYTWSPGTIHGSSLAISPTVTTFYYVVGLDGNGCENKDSISIRVSECTGLVGANNEKTTLFIYPNPNTGEFKIRSLVDLHLKFYNELGQLVRIIELTKSNDYEVNISDLENGIYFIYDASLKRAIKRKVIVNR